MSNWKTSQLNFGAKTKISLILSILKVGENVKSKSMPLTWLYPLATILTLNFEKLLLLSLLILNVHRIL